MARNALPPTEDPAKAGIRKGPASGSGTHAVGAERPDAGMVAKAQGIVGESSMGAAVRELHSQHPHAYDSHGPHHGTSDHIRHETLGGLRPTK